MKNLIIKISLLISFIVLLGSNAKADTTYVDLDTITHNQIMTFCHDDTLKVFYSSYPNPINWIRYDIGMVFDGSPYIIITKNNMKYMDNSSIWQTWTGNTNGNWTITYALGPGLNKNFYIYFTDPAIEPWTATDLAICGESEILYAGDGNYQEGFNYFWTEDGVGVVAEGYYPSDTSLVVDHDCRIILEITSGCNTVIDTIDLTVTTNTPPNIADFTVCGEDIEINPMISGYDTYLWDVGSTDSTASFNTPGWHWVDVENACIAIRDSFYIYQYDYPTLDLGPDQTICLGTSITLTTGFDYSDISGGQIWYNMADTTDLMPGMIHDTTFTVTDSINILVVAIVSGCPMMRDSITIDVSHPYAETRMCVVTVDQASGKNLIVWEKVVGAGIASYNISREIGVGSYALIANVLFDDPAQYLDVDSDPLSHTDRYKVSVIDTCDNESELSFYHQSIFATHSESGGTHYVIIADGYQEEEYVITGGASGYTPSQYYILEDITGTGTAFAILDSMSASYSSYGITSPVPGAVYAVAIQQPWNCEGGLILKSVTTDVGNLVLSNRIDIATSSEEYIMPIANISIYPNPSSGIFQIESDKEIVQLEIYTITGQTILLTTTKTIDLSGFEKDISGQTILFTITETIDLRGFEKGIYFAKITTTLGLSIEKLILQ